MSDTPESAKPNPAPTPPTAPPQSGAPNPGPGGAPRGRNDRPYPKGANYKPQRPRNEGPQSPTPPPQRDIATPKPSKRMLDQSIEAELAASLAGLDFGGAVDSVELANQQNKPKTKGPTGKRTGTVVSIRGNDVFIEVPGGRSQGVMPLMQFEGKAPKIGDIIEFVVERYDNANGLLLLNREGASQTVTDMSSLTMHMIVDAKVTGVNKNRTGLMIEVNGIKGFMPISQIDLYRVENPEVYVNQTLKCEVIELDRQERNLIVSRKSILERERMAKLEQFWAAIKEGETRTGIVRNIKPFGVFVDLEGADGMIPVSELSWQRVKDPSEVVAIGQKVEVVVKRLDPETRRISLSLRQLLHNPWDDFVQKNRPGMRITGTVTRIMDFGAFVELAGGIEGLIHLSELSTQRVRRVRDSVTEGQKVEVQILSVDPEQKRIGLSLKTIMAGEEAIAEAAEEAERLADLQAAEEIMTTRKPTPGLRGGIGAGPVTFDTQGS